MTVVPDLPFLRGRAHKLSVADYPRQPGYKGATFRRIELVRGYIIDKTPISPLHGMVCTSIMSVQFTQRLVRSNIGWCVLKKRAVKVYTRPLNGAYREMQKPATPAQPACSSLPGVVLELSQIFEGV